MSRSLVVSVSVVTANENDAVKALEAFARVAAGLALDGLPVSVTIGSVEDDDDEDS